MDGNLEDVNILHREILKNKKLQNTRIKPTYNTDSEDIFFCLQQDGCENPTVTFISIQKNGELI